MCLQARQGCAYCGAIVLCEKILYCTWSRVGECTYFHIQDRMLPGPFQQCDCPRLSSSDQETTKTENEVVEGGKEYERKIELAS